MRFRPCIDLHNGSVKQIVGSTLSDRESDVPVTNFEATYPPRHYADMYWEDALQGGHVIMLGPGNETAARDAVGAHPGFMQIGGGITPDNALEWLSYGASKVIVTSYLFVDGELSLDRVREMHDLVGTERLVLDLSCRRRDGHYRVVCDRWQTFTSFALDADGMRALGTYCSEFLVHAVDVEGKQCGVDADLIRVLGDGVTIPTTYAGGICSWGDINLLREAGGGRLDFTVGSALDIFGGTGFCYSDLVRRMAER